MPKNELIARTCALLIVIGMVASCGSEEPPRSDEMIKPACLDGGPVPPRGAGETAVTFGQLECQGLIPDLRGVAPPTAACQSMGGTEISAFPAADQTYVCCMVQNRGERAKNRSICLPGEFG